MSRSGKPRSGLSRHHWHWLLVLILYATVVAGYWVLRYATLWSDTDTSSLAQHIGTVRDQGTILPHDEGLYPHGFNYQAVSVMILAATGVSLQVLQSTVYPLVAAVALALAAFAFYAQLARRARVAALAVLFLFIQPDVLFVILRGSHEKLDWPLMMVALTFLCLSLRRPTRLMAAFVPLFYLVAFAMIATNTFFASTFLVSVTLSLVLGLLVSSLLRHRTGAAPGLQRLAYISLSGLLLVFAFIFYVYPPGLYNIRTLPAVIDKIGIFLLGFRAEGQPYEYISYAWINLRVYLGLTIFTWLLIVLSLAEWIRRGVQFLRSTEKLDVRADLDWLLYAGFAIQVGIAMVMDLSGAVAGNLQLRLFPAFTVLAVALLARGAARMATKSWFRGWTKRATLGVVAVAMAWFGVAALLKATNEPILSNKWTFYTESDKNGMEWAEDHLQEAAVWAGLDERLDTMFLLENPGLESSNTYGSSDLDQSSRYVVSSQQDRLRAPRMGLAMPSVLTWNRVYDNGDFYLYHRRAHTPYQR